MVDYAAGFIKRGEVVGVPTDTFYGLSADPFNLAAIEAVFQAKGRPETKALPILVSSIEQAVTLMREVPDIFLVLAHKFWPGALTLVVEATHRLPLKVTGNSGRVALRWANSPIPTAIIERCRRPNHRHERESFGVSFLHECGANREAAWKSSAADSRCGRHRGGAGFDNRAHRWRSLDSGTRGRTARSRHSEGFAVSYGRFAAAIYCSLALSRNS